MTNKKSTATPQIIPPSVSNLQNPLTFFEEEDVGKKLKKIKVKEVGIVFFGNTRYSAIGAQILHQTLPINLVVTIPDRQIGRNKTLTASPVKIMAQHFDLPIIETNKLEQHIIDQIALYQPDFLVVEDYGLILPNSLLEVPKYAPLNIHHSLLPKYRGPSPAPAAILAGEKVSGVTIIRMTDKVDAGEVLAQREYPLKLDETTDSLLTALNKLGGELVIQVIQDYLEEKAQPKPQDDTQANKTKFIKKEDGYFDLDNPPDPEKLDRMIRAYYPWPNVWTRWQGKIVKFLPEKMVQMEGKKAVKLADFLNGYPNFPLKEVL